MTTAVSVQLDWGGTSPDTKERKDKVKIPLCQPGCRLTPHSSAAHRNEASSTRPSQPAVVFVPAVSSSGVGVSGLALICTFVALPPSCGELDLPGGRCRVCSVAGRQQTNAGGCRDWRSRDNSRQPVNLVVLARQGLALGASHSPVLRPLRIPRCTDRPEASRRYFCIHPEPPFLAPGHIDKLTRRAGRPGQARKGARGGPEIHGFVQCQHPVSCQPGSFCTHPVKSFAGCDKEDRGRCLVQPSSCSQIEHEFVTRFVHARRNLT